MFDPKKCQKTKQNVHIIGENICVDGTKKKPVDIPALWESIKVKKLILNHRSGGIGDSVETMSNFGSKNGGYGILITKGENVFAPDFNHDASLRVVYKLSNSKPVFWELEG